MQASTIVASASLQVSEGRQLWNAFRCQVQRLSGAEVEPDNLNAYYALVEAYKALRKLYVTSRKGRGRIKPGRREPSLERFAEQRAKFQTKFWGVDEGRWVGSGLARKWKSKRAFLGVAPAVRAVMEQWSELRNAWHRHTPAGHRQRAKADRKYMRTEAGQAVKAAYLASDAGKAVRERGIKATKRKRAVARGEAQQALFDSWAIESSIEGALKDV